eukprot:3544564-Pyramimonas_sp.AAC.1
MLWALARQSGVAAAGAVRVDRYDGRPSSSSRLGVCQHPAGSLKGLRAGRHPVRVSALAGQAQVSLYRAPRVLQLEVFQAALAGNAFAAGFMKLMVLQPLDEMVARFGAVAPAIA